MGQEKQRLRDASSHIALTAFLADIGELVTRMQPQQRTPPPSRRKKKKAKKKQKYHQQAKHKNTATINPMDTAMPLLEQLFPELTNASMMPFNSWHQPDDPASLYTVASKHFHAEQDNHLQQILAIANHIASGLDQHSFQPYATTPKQPAKKKGKKKHQTSTAKKQLTLFEQIDIRPPEDKKAHKKRQTQPTLKYRYDLKPLSPHSIFPVLAKDCERQKPAQITQEYRTLWQQFSDDLERIPRSHQYNLGLWLDHFDTLWATYAHNVPASTQDPTQAGISLYDHSKTTAALATALWRYHHETGFPNTSDTSESSETLDQQWDQSKFLLIQGDFFGIQSFIFANGGASNKKAAKLLRGRSFYVSLLTECAALCLLDALSLPATSQMLNAAGKFIIVAPNTEQTKTALKKVQQQFDQWFLTHSWGQSGIGLAWQEASCNDFSHAHYKSLIERLYHKLDIAKHQRLTLCHHTTLAPTVFAEYLDSFDNEKGVCEIDGRSPAIAEQDGISVGALAKDQIDCGRFIVNDKLERLLISRKEISRQRGLGLPLFGYYISFSKDEIESGKFGALARQDQLLRLWDFSLPQSETATLWNGYARRHINSFVPLFDDTSVNEKQQNKYSHCDDEEFGWGRVKSFSHLACEDKQLDQNSRQWRGNNALMSLKGDIDNLGLMFKSGLNDTNFSKMAALSRQVNAFFAIYLPWLCQSDTENKTFQNTYTVFAGGDDFFLIGSWHSQIKLARYLQQAFQRYVANNSQVHFSVGLTMTKANVPITYLAETSENALDKAKDYNPNKQKIEPKNAVNCFGIGMSWDEFNELAQREQALTAFKQHFNLSTGYIYGLLNLVEMKEDVQKDPSKSIWHSYFAYRTYRLLERDKKLNEHQRRAYYAQLAQEISAQGIEHYGEKYKVALFTHLYTHRY